MHDFVSLADWHINCSVAGSVPPSAEHAQTKPARTIHGAGWAGSNNRVYFSGDGADAFTRIFLWSLSQEDKKTEDEAREELRRSSEESGLADSHSANHTP
jgi:hypothetical protein